MPERPLVSVIVPIYGIEDYIDDCIKSIINQTYDNLEIILVDDGSPDNCPAIIESWAKHESSIIVLHKKNGGLSSARNAGMEVAKGEYIVFIDGDDWIEQQYIEKLVDIVIRYKSDIGVIGFNRTYENGKKVPSQYHINGKEICYPSPVNQAIKYFFEKAIAVWGKIYSSKIIGKTRFIEGRLAEDIPFQVEILKKASHVAFYNDNLYNYRQRTGSIARTIKPKYLYDHIRSLSEALDECRQFFQFEEKYCLSWLSSLLYEYCATQDFSKAIVDSDNLIAYAINQCGGKERIIKNIDFPEAIIYNTFLLFKNIASVNELRILQKDYRSVFPSKKVQNNKCVFLLKYLPSYFSINLIQMIRKIFERS